MAIPAVGMSGGHPDIMEERGSEGDAYCSVQACGAFGNYFFLF